MKYRILMMAGRTPRAPGDYEKPDEYRAQRSRFGLFWTDLQKVNWGHYQEDLVPKTYGSREHAQSVIDKDIRDRSSPPPQMTTRKWVKL